MFEGLSIEVERLEEAGGKVVALIRVSGTGRASGLSTDISIAHLWTLRDGVVVVGEGYGNRDQALRAVGLSD